MGAHRVRVAAVALLITTLGFTTGCVADGTPVPSPNDVSSAQLVETPAAFDGGEVTFAGEAIGEAMVRGDMAWLHLNDDAYHQLNTEEGTPLGGYNSGMAVWIPRELTDGIEHYGDHSDAGDIVQVIGTFKAACAEHGGDMDIHAASLEVVAPGRRVREPLNGDKAVWAAILALVAAAAYATDRMLIRTREDRGR